MYKKQSYNTKARKYILEYLKEHKDVTVSAADIIMHLKSLDITVDQATVYRCLNRLVGDETVSYTHLDVYKRQPFIPFLPSAPFNADRSYRLSQTASPLYRHCS